jgi:hypothetical protein
MRRSLCLLIAAVLASAAPVAHAAEVDPLLPKDSTQVVQVNVKQILQSDVFKKNFLGRVQKGMENEEVKRQFELFGIDPFKDVEKVVVGISGKDPSDTKVLAVLRGKFNPEKLFEGVQEHASRTPDRVSLEDVEDGDEKWKLVKVSPDRGGKPFYVSLASDTTLVAGNDSTLVTTALNAAKKKERAKLDKDMAALVLKQEEKASLFYCTLTAGRIETDKIPEQAFDPLKVFGIDGEVLKRQIAAISSFAVTVRLGKEVGVEVVAGMKDEDTAEEFGGAKSNLSKLVDTAKAFLPLAGNQSPKSKPLIDDVMKTLTTKVKGKDVTATVTVTADAVASAFSEDEGE